MTQTLHEDSSAAITAAELRVARELLGVTGDWLADTLGVASRTVRRWEAGASPIPAGVATEIHQMQTATDAFVEDVVAALLEDDPDEHGHRWVVVHGSEQTYRLDNPDSPWSAGWHRAAIGRAAQAVPGTRLSYVGEVDE